MLISVIIPTRERSKYLRHSLQTALDIQDDNVEIVISDNASQDTTPDLLAQVSDPRLRVVRAESRLSMRQNFQFALDHARGEYVIYLGDDDGMLPRQFSLLRRILEEKTPDGMSWSLNTYSWPGAIDGKSNGQIRIRNATIYGGIEDFDISSRKAAVERCDMRRFNFMPRLYHGAVSRNYLQRAANSDSVFFCGSIPDVYFSYRALQAGGRFIYCNHPFSLNGYSPASTGGSHGAKSANEQRGDPAKKFASENLDDPLRDVINGSMSLPLWIFSTVETLNARFPSDRFDLDYLNWYSWVLSDSSEKSRELAGEIEAILLDHASGSKTLEFLEGARSRPPYKPRKTIFERYNQLLENLRSIRVSAAPRSYENIADAVRRLDMVLAEDYDLVLSGQISGRQAWLRAKKRGRGAN